MKNSYTFLLLPIILFLLTGCSNNDDSNKINTSSSNQVVQNNETNTQNTIATRITVPLNTNNTTNTANTQNTTNTTHTTDVTNTTNTTNEVATTNNTTSNTTETTNVSETELSSFSTNILTSDPNRNNNIQLTCDVLNEHIVSAGETFSFTGLVGKSTSNKGYKQANVISSNGDTIKGLGGGNCQVSSTLYNAVAAVPELEVIERHNHGSEVHYVPIGKDAAVAYGSLDFKFKNKLSSDIKIYASSDDKVITIKITKIM